MKSTSPPRNHYTFCKEVVFELQVGWVAGAAADEEAHVCQVPLLSLRLTDRLQATKEQLSRFSRLSPPESQAQHMALTVVYVPYSLDRGAENFKQDEIAGAAAAEEAHVCQVPFGSERERERGGGGGELQREREGGGWGGGTE